MPSIKLRHKTINHEPIQQAFWTKVERCEWEHSTFNVLDKHIKEGKAFIDIGAWNGVLSLYVANLGASCYCIEPDPVALQYLNENIALNPDLHHRMLVTDVAISDRIGFGELRTETGGWGNSESSLVHREGEKTETKSVATVDLLTFVERMCIRTEDISLIKMDIEGAEVQVLNEAKHFLKNYRPKMYISLHPTWFANRKEDTVALADILFSLYRVLLNGEYEITKECFIAETAKRDLLDVLLLPRDRTVALIIPVYNRSDYLRQTIDGLRKQTWKVDRMIVIDDASTEFRLEDFKEVVSIEDIDVTYISKSLNLGIKDSIQVGCDKAFTELNCDTAIVLDPDAIVKPDFIERVLTLHKQTGLMASGFNCVTDRNPIVDKGPDYVLKHHCNGINVCFSQEQYYKYIEPTLPKVGNWDYNMSLSYEADDKLFAIASPSVVQHIGKISAMGHVHVDGSIDQAQDFRKISLPQVTLFAIDAHNPAGIKRAADICQRDIQFGEVIVITERLFPGATLQEGRENYSKFMIKDLDSYIQTSHVLTIHVDGYILRPDAWDPAWLEYDYLGAPWYFEPDKRVGNGGFSLRSKKLLNILATDPEINQFFPEDSKICRFYHDYLVEAYNIKFAPVEVAHKFSVEGWDTPKELKTYTGQFGFHSPWPIYKNVEQYGVNPADIYRR
jgi:FkbM family methyltransferase